MRESIKHSANVPGTMEVSTCLVGRPFLSDPGTFPHPLLNPPTGTPLGFYFSLSFSYRHYLRKRGPQEHGNFLPSPAAAPTFQGGRASDLQRYR